MNIMVNFTGSEVAYDPEQAGLNTDKTEVLMSGYEDTMDARPTSIGVLRPYEAVIIQSRAEH